MRRAMTNGVAALGLCLLVAGLARADVRTMYVNRLPAQTYSGVYVGPAGASFNTAVGRPWDFDIICNDYARVTWVPSSFAVSVTKLTDVAGATTRFSGLTGAVLRYQQAAWLVDQMYLNISNGTTVGQIQFAMWELFYSPTPNNYGGWYANALAADLSGYDFSRFEILTPWDSVGGKVSATNQEFLRRRVPEPAMAGTLLFGLLGVGLLWKRRVVKA